MIHHTPHYTTRILTLALGSGTLGERSRCAVEFKRQRRARGERTSSSHQTERSEALMDRVSVASEDGVTE